METENIKTAALLQAKNALKDYLKKHNLNPMKDWRKDKVHGKEVTRLVTRLNLERDKVLDNYPYNDISNETKLVKMKDKKQKAEKEAKKANKAAKEVAAKAATQEAPAKEAKKEKKDKAPKASVPGKYDYPLIDGREMTAAEKKKYRAEQRRLAAGGEAKPKAEKKPKAEAAPAPEAPTKKEKKDKKKAKDSVPEKPLKEKKDKKKDKKKSKAKDED